jgi:hypothetical protein
MFGEASCGGCGWWEVCGRTIDFSNLRFFFEDASLRKNLFERICLVSMKTFEAFRHEISSFIREFSKFI